MIVKVQPHDSSSFSLFVFVCHHLHPISDKQRETCDKPEDPMSEAESEVVDCIFSVCL